jgi:hypothetical protein
MAAAVACCCLPPAVGVELQSTAEELQSAPGSHLSSFVAAAGDGWAPRTSSLGNHAPPPAPPPPGFVWIHFAVPPPGHAQGGDFGFSSLPFLLETTVCMVAGRRDASDARNRRAGRWRGSSAVGPTSPGWAMQVADVFCLSEMHELLELSIFAIRVTHCTHEAKRVLPLRNASSRWSRSKAESNKRRQKREAFGSFASCTVVAFATQNILSPTAHGDANAFSLFPAETDELAHTRPLDPL